MRVSPKTTPKPSPLLALAAAAIVGASDRRWLAQPISALAREHDVSAQHVSRLRAKLQPGFEQAVAVATRRGRPPAAPPQVSADPVAEALLAVSASVMRQVRVPRRSADCLVAAADRMHREHGLTQRDFCKRIGVSPRTFRHWKNRPPAPPMSPPPVPSPPDPKPDRNPGRFRLEVTLPGIQLMSDTTDWNLFGVKLKVTTAMDPGNRHRRPWEAFTVEATETAEVVADTIERAVADRTGMLVSTDQGSTFMAELSRAAYDAMHADHAPCAEGAPTQKSPVERSYREVKRLLEPLAHLTRRLAELIPTLRTPAIAQPLAALLLGTYLRVFELGHRDRPHPLEAADPQRLRHIAEEQREKARHETDSKRLLLGRIFDILGCSGSREHFIRIHRDHHLHDIHAAQRMLFNNWSCCCRIRTPDRYFGKLLSKAADYGRQQRQAEHARRRAADHREHQQRAEHARDDFLVRNPDQLLRLGLDLVLVQAGSQLGSDLLRQRRGPGPRRIQRALGLLRVADPLVFHDVVEATWRAWNADTLGTKPNLEPLLPTARRILDELLNPEPADSDLTPPEPRVNLPLRARINNPRPPKVLRNFPARLGGS